MAVWSNRLNQGGLTLADVYKMSRKYYKTEVDDKSRRARIDVKSARFTKQNNRVFNQKTKEWEQTGESVKLEFLVKSIPTSYKKIDNRAVHYYPVFIVIHNLDRGMSSTFLWRTGSLKKPLFAKKGDSREKRIKIANINISRKIQLNFFFCLEYTLKMKGLLYGVNYATRRAKRMNPKNRIYFDKTMYFLVNKILIKLFRSDKFKLLIGKTYK